MFSSEPHPWFQPLYRRILTFAVCVGWLILELTGEQSFWLVLAAGMTGYALWEFFLSPTYRGGGKAAPPTQED